MDLDTPAGMQDAANWVTSIINLLKDEGSWAVPRSGTIYTFHKTLKHYTRIGGGDPATERVLEHLGWTFSPTTTTTTTR